jgi:hypothetical protein
MFDYFQSLNYGGQKAFIDSMIEQVSPNIKLVKSKRPRVRTYNYFLKIGNSKNKHQICKTMFLHTLGFKSDGVLKRLYKGQANNNGIPLTIDRRGKYGRKKTDLLTEVKEFLKQYNPRISHYRLNHSPKRKYINSIYNMKTIYKQFQVDNPSRTTTYNTFANIIRELNISFERPTMDQCETCLEARTQLILITITHAISAMNTNNTNWPQ